MTSPNPFPFSPARVVFATQHGKDDILKHAFADIGLELIAANVNTDLFGTFSGEVNRTLSIRESMRAKIHLAQDLYARDRFFLASEGSFGPHPISFVVGSDLESLLFIDKVKNVEIYAEYFTTEIAHTEVKVSKDFEIKELSEQFQLPSHGVIVRPDASFEPIFKGVHDPDELRRALEECLKNSENGQAVVLSDLRAHHNPTRQNAILKAGEKLIESLLSFCPECDQPGFMITSGIEGLRCEACDSPSRYYESVIYSCAYCDFEKITSRPDGLKFITIDECEFCNP